MDKTLGLSDSPDVQRRRGEELRKHLVRSKSVALIKVRLPTPSRPCVKKKLKMNTGVLYVTHFFRFVDISLDKH